MNMSYKNAMESSTTRTSNRWFRLWFVKYSRSLEEASELNAKYNSAPVYLPNKVGSLTWRFSRRVGQNPSNPQNAPARKKESPILTMSFTKKRKLTKNAQKKKTNQELIVLQRKLTKNEPRAFDQAHRARFHFTQTEPLPPGPRSSSRST